ncbi:MAG TPA: hypothetical protein VHT27_03255 [Solirubrobacteraceae bacterium]|jgi:hypothetical protein|nr:hypothetical protein [Solirubrobacteraceae bacterium]
MPALPTLLATGCAWLLARPLLGALAAGGAVRANYRDRRLPFPFGLLVPLAACLALAPLALAQALGVADVLPRRFGCVLLLCLGVAGLGLIDDALPGRLSARSGRAARGVRAHAAAVARGELSTGAIKAVGTIILALVAAAGLQRPGASQLVGAGVITLSAHVFNLLDLRPGRAPKAFALLLAAVAAGTGDARALWAVGLFAGPALVAGAFDLRERALLGDTGASVLGALAGVLLVLALPAHGQLVALGALAAVSVYGELGSISRLIEATPGLRKLDSLGRPS